MNYVAFDTLVWWAGGALLLGVLLLLLVGAAARSGFVAGATSAKDSERPGAPLVWVRPTRWPSLDSPAIRVYREPEIAAAAAQGVFEAGLRVDKALHELFPSLRRPKLGLVLLARERYLGRRVATPGFALPLLVDTANQDAWLNGLDARTRLFSFVPHEWVEWVLAWRLYWRDRRARWIGDGAAEYAGYRVALALDPEVGRARLARLAERLGPHAALEQYDLTTEFQVGTRASLNQPVEARRRTLQGYAVSFAVFYALAERQGHEAVARLITKVLGGPWPTSARARRLVSSAMGSEGPPLSAVPLVWVSERLQDAARALDRTAASGATCQ